MKRILICPNAFKHALSSIEVSHAIMLGLQESSFACDLVELPIADGGDGSLEIIDSYLHLVLHEKEVVGPLGKNVRSRFGMDGRLAVIELADASGIKYVSEQERNVWKASSYGTGQLIHEAIERGADKIYLTVGGSASVDGGLGILKALGVRFLDRNSNHLENVTVADIHQIVTIDLSRLVFQISEVKFTVLCDVENPLLGPEGAARVFAPQKGAKADDVVKLDGIMSYWADLLEKQFGKRIHELKGAGAAGGVAGMMSAIFNAELTSGAEQILEWASFEENLQNCDIVITGEGKIDEQTGYGKGPGLVAQKAKAVNKKVIGLCGAVDHQGAVLQYFDAVFSVTNGAETLRDALSKTEINLRHTAFQLGQILSFD